MRKNNVTQRNTKIPSLIILFTLFCVALGSVSSGVILNTINDYEETNIIIPSADAYIDQTMPQKSYITSSGLCISNAHGNNSSGWQRDILLYFDVTTLPTYAQITTGTLYLYYYGYDETDPVQRMVSIYPITTDWDSENVTWETRPTSTLQNISYTRVPETYGWMAWDVTTETQRIISSPSDNKGWLISDKNPYGNHDIPIIKFKSMETQTMYAPYLEIHAVIPLMTSTNGPYAGCVDEPVVFQGNVIDGGAPPYSWQWDFGDGSTSQQQNSTYTYSSAGAYTISLTVYDSMGATATTTTTANIKENNSEPSITIQQPHNGLYFGNKKIVSLKTSVLLGPIDIIVETQAKNPIVKVKFLLDNVVQYVDFTAPYTWTWNQKLCWGKHILKVIAVDSAEASAVDEIAVWKLF